MNSPFFRIGAGLAIALPLAFLVVSIMARVIYVEEIELAEKEPFTLVTIVPDAEQSETRTSRRTITARRNTTAKPPPIKKMKVNKADINIEAVNLDVAPPADLNIGRMSAFTAVPISISDRDARPIRPPPRKYPKRALERGIEGSCEVSFDVDTRGKPFNISADCTSPMFKSEAERSVSRAEFAPKIQNGQPVQRRGVVYPMEFVISS